MLHSIHVVFLLKINFAFFAAYTKGRRYHVLHFKTCKQLENFIFGDYNRLGFLFSLPMPGRVRFNGILILQSLSNWKPRHLRYALSTSMPPQHRSETQNVREAKPHQGNGLRWILRCNCGSVYPSVFNTPHAFHRNDGNLWLCKYKSVFKHSISPLVGLICC